MMYQFHASLHIAGKDFPRGVHEVEKKQELHPHFLTYVKAGLISEAKPKPKENQKSADLKNKQLLDKLVKERDEVVQAEASKKEAQAEAAVVEEAPAEAKAEAVAPSESEAKPKGKHGKNRGK